MHAPGVAGAALVALAVISSPIWAQRATQDAAPSNFDAPAIAEAGGSLVAESVPNGRLDTGELVTLALCITNNAGSTSGSVTGTLLAGGGVLAPSGAQVYGAIAPAGNVCRTYSLTVGPACGATLTATLQAQEMGGLTSNLSYAFEVGSQVASLSENFDGVAAPALPAGWTTDYAGGVPNPWVTSVTTPDSAPNRAFAGNPSSVTDNRLVSPMFGAPLGSVLTFRHSYNTEPTFDGGVLEMSIGGGIFVDIGGIIVSGGYNGTLSTCCSNPLAGRQAWTGNSGGYLTTTLNMPPGVAGMGLVLRWRMATDSSVAATGWAVDSIRVYHYQCSDLAPVITTHPLSQTVMSGQTTTLSVVAAGTPPLTYQWYQGPSPNTATPIIGATSATYTTPALVAPAAYWVRVVNNLFGQANSNTATISIGPAPNTEMITNGNFSAGTTNWQVFEVADIVWSVVGGVFQWYRANPTTTPSGQATVFQETGLPVAAAKPLRAAFDLGNSSTVRKRVSVLIVDSNFSDITVCTFWLAPGAPLRSYTMYSHTTKNWANAAIYFYAATKGADGGNYLLDNVSLRQVGLALLESTACFDPTAPAPPGGAPSAELLGNGDFETGTLGPWGSFGTIAWQIAGGVLEFIRPTATPPSGVILQSTGQAMAANQIMTATFQLGNSSSVRKRVTVLLHDASFGDLTACTFWLAPLQPLWDYSMYGFATQAWPNATLSFYPATTGAETWMRLDNASFQRTPGSFTMGTGCYQAPFPPLVDPDGGGSTGSNAKPGQAAPSPAVRAPAVARPPASRRAPGDESGILEVSAAEDGPRTLWQQTIDLRDADQAGLSLESRLIARDSTATIEVSLDDGTTWTAIGVPPAAEEWLAVSVDLSPYAGQIVRVRMQFDAVRPRPGMAPDVWGIRDVRVTSRR